MPRRDGESNEPMKSIPGMPYHWFSIVTLRGSPQETPTEIGKKLAASFSAFSAPEFESKTFQFRGDSSSTPPLSLNNYLLDRDCIMYLKKIYFGVSKEEIMQDDETLAEFFVSPKEGKRLRAKQKKLLRQRVAHFFDEGAEGPDSDSDIPDDDESDVDDQNKATDQPRTLWKNNYFLLLNRRTIKPCNILTFSHHQDNPKQLKKSVSGA